MDLLSFQKGELLAPIYEELEGLLIKPREQLAQLMKEIASLPSLKDVFRAYRFNLSWV